MFFIEWTYDDKAWTFEAQSLTRAIEIRNQLSFDQNDHMADIFNEEGPV